MARSQLHHSTRVYHWLLKLYPQPYRQEFGEEMQYLFSQSLKDAHAERGEHGVISVWLRTLTDTGKSLIIQHLENQKGNHTMKTKASDLIMQNKAFAWVAAITGLILCIPLVAMQFTSEVNWDLEDFMIMGILLFGAGSLFVIIGRLVNPQHRLAVGILVLLAVLWLWAELAVGIFTNWGS